MGACVSTDRDTSTDDARDPRVPRFERPRRAEFSGRTAVDLNLDLDRCVTNEASPTRDDDGKGPVGRVARATNDLGGDTRAIYKHRVSPRKVEDDDDRSIDSPRGRGSSESPRAVGEFGDDDSIEEADERTIRWQRGELVGSGGFGRVYVGLDLDTGGMLAVKQIVIAPRIQRVAGVLTALTNNQRVDDDESDRAADESVRRIEQEVALMRRLKHPNIVSYLGTERTREDVFTIFMEYVPGGSIHSLLQRFGSFGETVIQKYTRQILLGLEYLHRHQIMHRDIKGANILVDNQGCVKLADFGASKRLAEIVTVDGVHKSIRGTPYWMAPEVIKQTGHGRQADIWSVGCTILEMATGKPPFSEFGSQVSALFHIASGTGPPPIPEFLSAEAHDFLILCFNRVPRDRPNASRLLRHPFAIASPSSGSNSPVKCPTRPDPAPPVDQLEPSTDLHADFSVHEGVAAVPEDQPQASVDTSKVVSIGEVVVRSKSEAQRRAGELEVEKKLRRAASSPLEVGGPVEPRVEHEDARRRQWEEELRRELEVQRAEMRRCHGRDRAVSAV